MKAYCQLGIYLEIPNFETTVSTLIKKDSKGNETDAIFDPYNGQKLKFEDIVTTQMSYAVGIDDKIFYNHFGENPEMRFFNPYFEKFGKNNPTKQKLVLLDESKYATEFTVDEDVFEIKNQETLIKEFETEYSNYIEYYRLLGFAVSVKFGLYMYYA